MDSFRKDIVIRAAEYVQREARRHGADPALAARLFDRASRWFHRVSPHAFDLSTLHGHVEAKVRTVLADRLEAPVDDLANVCLDLAATGIGSNHLYADSWNAT